MFVVGYLIVDDGDCDLFGDSSDADVDEVSGSFSAEGAECDGSAGVTSSHVPKLLVSCISKLSLMM